MPQLSIKYASVEVLGCVSNMPRTISVVVLASPGLNCLCVACSPCSQLSLFSVGLSLLTFLALGRPLGRPARGLCFFFGGNTSLGTEYQPGEVLKVGSGRFADFE